MNFELDNPFEAKNKPAPSKKPETSAEKNSDELLVAQARKLDQKFARLFVEQMKAGAEELQKTMDKLDTIDVLTYGTQEDKTQLEGAGINESNAYEYQLEESPMRNVDMVEGVTKPSWGEVAFTVYEGTPVRVSKKVEDGELIEELTTFVTAIPQEKALARYVESEMEYIPLKIKRIAKTYDISVDEVPMSREQISFRLGIDVGQQTRSEFTVSRIDALTGLQVVPVTVLRKDKYGIASVQEKISAIHVDEKIIKEVLAQKADQPGPKSIIRMACLDYLIRSSDRHFGNFMYDEVSEEFIGIDHGMTMGLSCDEEVDEVDVDGNVLRTKLENRSMDVTESVPMEMVDFREDWYLDDEAHGIMRQLFVDLESYSAYVKIKNKTLEMEESVPRHVREGDAMSYLMDLFKFQFKHEKIAAKELQHFIERLAYIVQHRRPPRVKEIPNFRHRMKAKAKPVN